MKQVLIVSKTRMSDGFCVSGLTASNQSIRLKSTERHNQAVDTEFEIGQLWEMEFQEDPNAEPPHVEDVYVTQKKYIREIPNLRATLLKRVQPWIGDPKNLFDQNITIEYNKAYIAKSGSIPPYSTGYWIPDRPLIWRQDPVKNKYFYEIEHNYAQRETIRIPFVGIIPPLAQIRPNTLVRVSLARWLPPYNNRCYLQISGWYE
jgi:ATP-dependent DNA helicase RecQ